MKNTVTLSQLITRLAETAKIDNNTSRRFIKALFDTVARQLEAGETVEIKGVGTFEAVDRDGRRSVTFTPDGALAAELNRPFEMFQAVELAPDVDFDAEMPEEAAESAELSENSEHSESSENSDTPSSLPTSARGCRLVSESRLFGALSAYEALHRPDESV